MAGRDRTRTKPRRRGPRGFVVDGRLERRGALEEIFFGGDGSGPCALPWDGLLDEIYILDRALPEAEVAALMTR